MLAKGLIYLIVALSPQVLWAATRVVPFAGMFSLEMQTPRLHSLNAVSFCNIAVVNVGGSAQNGIVITGFGFAGGSTNAGGAVACDPSAALASTASCYASYQINTFLDSDRIGICAGTISVTDADPLAPGSVVATGSMTVFQEAMVVGGVLSGGHYASGNVITPSGVAGQTSGSMNMNCAVACQQSSGVPSNRNRVCETLCGVMSIATPYFAPIPTTIAGTIDNNNSADGGSSGLNSTPVSVYHYAPAYYGGGSVYELELGALDAICNGNPTFVSDGYTQSPHDHAGGSAQHNSEVLFCGHRHNQPDLYLKVGQSIPIVINGGSAF